MQSLRLMSAPTLSVAAAVSAAACGWPFGTNEDGWFHARIESTEEVIYRGSGDFSVSQNRELGDRWEFAIISSSVDSVGPSSLDIFGIGFERPQEGTYELQFLSLEDMGRVSTRGFTAAYDRLNRREDTGEPFGETFVADSGNLTITSSSSDRVTGTVSFVAFRRCPPYPDEGSLGCQPASPRQPEDPTVTVTGSFEARPFEARGNELLRVFQERRE